MPSVRYYNQTAPFWDFIASMEEQGSSHPFFAAGNNSNDNNHHNEDSDNEHQPNPITDGWAGFPFGPMPHRGRHGGPRGHHGGPMGPPPPPPPFEHEDPSTPKDMEPNNEEGPSEPKGPPPFSEGPHRGPPRHHDSEEGAMSDGPKRGPGHHHKRGPHCGPGADRGRIGGRGRGGFGGRGRGGPFGHHGFGPMGGFGGLAEMFQSQLFGDGGANKEGTEDFKPEVDVFDTTDSYVVHVSLPGAKKEDVGVNWDPEKSELNVAGVIHRPGDEDFLKTLALDERKVGAFERKVRLGSRANPAQVEVDAISARMEDGVLRIDVPKLDSGYVEIKKVDIE